MNRFKLLKQKDSTTEFYCEPIGESPVFLGLHEIFRHSYDLLQRPSDREELTQAITEQISERILRRSIVGRVLHVDNFESIIELPIYDISDQGAYYIVTSPPPRINFCKDRRLVLPNFSIASNVEISLAQIRHGRQGDLFVRAVDYIVQDIINSEENNLVTLLSTASEKSKKVVRRANFGVSSLRDAFNEFDVHNIIMNSNNWILFRRCLNRYVEEASVAVRETSSFRGTFMGAQVSESHYLDDSTILFSAEPVFTGVMSIGQNITGLSADNPATIQIGWHVSEHVGMFCFPQSVMKLEIQA